MVRINQQAMFCCMSHSRVCGLVAAYPVRVEVAWVRFPTGARFCRVIKHYAIVEEEAGRLWSSGRIPRCHRGDQGSIPGRRTFDSA